MAASEIDSILEGYALFPTAFHGEDMDSYLELFTPDVEWIPITAALEGRVYRGHEGMREWFEDLRSDWEEFRPIPEEVREIGGGWFLVVGHWEARGRASGVTPAGGDAAWLLQRRDGRTAKLRTFTRRDDALAALADLEPDR